MRVNHPPQAAALIPWLLALLAVWDLRTELQLLADHLTLTSLVMLPLHHPLAVAVLVCTPSLWRCCRRGCCGRD